MSINKITYLHQIIPSNFFVFADFLFHLLYFSDFIEVKQFLDLLEIDNQFTQALEEAFKFFC